MNRQKKEYLNVHAVGVCFSAARLCKPQGEAQVGLNCKVMTAVVRLALPSAHYYIHVQADIHVMKKC